MLYLDTTSPLVVCTHGVLHREEWDAQSVNTRASPPHAGVALAPSATTCQVIPTRYQTCLTVAASGTGSRRRERQAGAPLFTDLRDRLRSLVAPTNELNQPKWHTIAPNASTPLSPPKAIWRRISVVKTFPATTWAHTSASSPAVDNAPSGSMYHSIAVILLRITSFYLYLICHSEGRATVHGGHPPSTWARDPRLAAALSVAADNCFGPPTAAPPPPPPPPPPIAVVAAPAGGQGQANLPVVIQAPVIPVAQGNRPAVDQDDEDIDNFVDQSGGPVVVQDLWVETHAQWDELGLSVPLEQQQESNDRRYAIGM